MGSGRSSSSSSTQNQDNRVVADAGALAVGQGANVTYTYTQGLDQNAVDLVRAVVDTVNNVTTGAGDAVNRALDTTKTVAERQQVTPIGNTLTDLFKSPISWVAGTLIGYAVLRKLKVA